MKVSTKISKFNNKRASEFERKFAETLIQIMNHTNTSTDVKAVLKTFKFTTAKEVEVSKDKKAILVVVPLKRLTPEFRKVQPKIVNELEKKFSGSDVVFIAKRRIVHKQAKSSKAPLIHRPRRFTVAAVHEALLNDVVFPSEITGKRIRVTPGGAKTHIIYLDGKVDNAEAKAETFSKIYSRITGKTAKFEIPVAPKTSKKHH